MTKIKMRVLLSTLLSVWIISALGASILTLLVCIDIQGSLYAIFEHSDKYYPVPIFVDCIGLGHTRWATHGDKTDINAHPHYDHKERIALIHNGLIENYHQLKADLLSTHGIAPVSQTDTEIVALYIGVYLDQGKSLADAISSCVSILEGAYSFVLISVLEPEAMYIVKNTGTMVILQIPQQEV